MKCFINGVNQKPPKIYLNAFNRQPIFMMMRFFVFHDHFSYFNLKIKSEKFIENAVKKSQIESHPSINPGVANPRPKLGLKSQRLQRGD
jgi:hypothetical protein